MAIARFIPGMLVRFCQKEDGSNKFPIPEDPQTYEPEDYPHFYIFCAIHLGRAFEDDTLESNADIIADVPMDMIESVTLKELIDLGLDNEASNYWD